MRRHLFVLLSAGLLAASVAVFSGQAAMSSLVPTGHTVAAAVGKVGNQRRPLACANNLAERLRTTDGAGQLITVEADSFQTSVAEVSLWQRDGSCWEQAGGPWTGLIGENGFSNHHREGDGTTPTGIYRIGPVVYGNAPNPGFRARTTVSYAGIGGTKTPLRPATTPSSTCRAAIRHRSAGTARLCGPRRPTTRALPSSSTTLIRWSLTRAPPFSSTPTRVPLLLAA